MPKIHLAAMMLVDLFVKCYTVVVAWKGQCFASVYQNMGIQNLLSQTMNRLLFLQRPAQVFNDFFVLGAHEKWQLGELCHRSMLYSILLLIDMHDHKEDVEL